MANVGTAPAGKTLIGQGNTTSPTFANIGTDSGLTNHGILLAQGNAAFVASAVGSAGQIFQSSGAGADPAYSTATYPSTTTINQILFSSANDTVTGLAAGNFGVLISNGTGVPSWLPNGTTGQVLGATTGGTPSWVNATLNFTTDSGSAVPSAGNINFVGALPTTTSSFPVSATGSGSTVSLRFNNSFPPNTIAGGGTANATFADYNFHYTAGGTLNLPQGGTVGISNGKSFYVADVGGTAGTTNITINPFAGDTIMGLSSYVLNTNYQSVILQWATGNRWIII